MASAAVVAAVRARLAALAPGVTVIGPNEALAPPAGGGRCITFALPPGGEQQVGSGPKAGACFGSAARSWSCCSNRAARASRAS